MSASWSRNVTLIGEPPVREEVPVGGLIRVEPGTALQTVNHGDQDLIVYAVRHASGERARRAARVGRLAARREAAAGIQPPSGG